MTIELLLAATGTTMSATTAAQLELIMQGASTGLLTSFFASSMFTNAKNNGFGVWWWNNIYRSNNYRVMLGNSDPYTFYKLLIHLVDDYYQQGGDKYIPSKRISIDDQTCEILHGEVPQKYLDQGYFNFPLNGFIINTVKTPGKKRYGRMLVVPIIDASQQSVGLDLWVYQRFWGIGYLRPRTVYKLIEDTVNIYIDKTGIVANLKKIKERIEAQQAQQAIQSQQQQQIQLIQLIQLVQQSQLTQQATPQ